MRFTVALLPMGYSLKFFSSQMTQILVGPCKLLLLSRLPGFPRTSHNSSVPAVGQELIQHNKRPPQCKQRIQSVQPRAKSWILAIEPFQRMTKALAPWQQNWRARMQKDIGRQLHRVVPTKILEVEKS